MDNNVVAKHILDVAVGLEKKSKNELITELSDIFDNASKIDLDSKENINSLKNLAKAFEAIFSKAGNKSINFENIIKMPPPAMFAEMGKIAATSFWDAWNSVSKGIGASVTAGLEESLKQLKLEQADLKRERTRIQAELSKKVSNKEKANNLIDFDAENVKPLDVDGDAIKKAKEMYSDLRNVAKQLSDIGKEQGQDSQEYIKALYKAQDIYHDLYRMRKTLQNLKTPVPQSLRAAYGLFEDYGEQVRYEEAAEKAGKKPTLPFYETSAGEFIGDRWERFAGTISKSQEKLNAVESRMSEIDVQISEITKSIQASGGAVDTVIKKEKDGLKTLNEIEAVYKRIRVDGEKRIDDRQAKHILSALEFDPTKSSEGIKTLYSQYQKAAESGDWVEEYRALLKYVRLYESYLTTTNKTHSNKITKKNNPFTPLYEQLKPMADNAQNMLQNILNIGEGKPLVGMGGTGKDGTGAGPTPEDVANAQKLREEAESKAKAEKEAREEAEKRLLAEKQQEESLKKQRAEEEKLAKAKKTATDARKEELGLMQAMDKFQGAFEKTDKKNETLAFLNTKTGNASELFVGDPHSVTMDPGTSRKMSELGYDMEVHSHSWKTAAPSVTDFETWFKQLGYIKKFGIRAGEELLAFDFSKLDPSQLLEVIEKYKDLDEKLSAQVQSMSFDEQKEKFGSYQGRQEAVQVMLRQGLEGILQNIPGVMQSIKMPELPAPSVVNASKKTSQVSLADEYAKANDEVKELIKNLAILYKNMDPNVDPGDGFDPITDAEEKLSKIAPEVLNADMSQWDKLYEKIVSEANARKQSAEAIKEETVAQEKLNNAQNQSNKASDEVTTRQNDLGQRQSPWALESTLQTVKDVLDSINSKIVKGEVGDSSGGDKTNNKNPYLLTDSNGKALTVYRGTRDSFGGFVANRTGTFGTDNPNIAKGYTHGDGKVFAYNVEMHNPLEIQAKGAQLKQIPNLGNAFEALTDPILKELRSLWSQITTLKEQLKTASGFDKEVTIPNKIGALQKRIQEISEDESHVYGVGGTDLFARKAKKNGYDGVIFRDLVDPSSGTPPQERVPSNIIVTFDESQMHLLETLSVVGNEISKVSAQDGEAGSDEPKVVEIDDAKGTSYALESTLQIVKGILDNIQTNTSKIGIIETPNVDTIAGTALDSRLSEIKSVLESIDNKISKGGVIATRGAVKQANAQPVESEAKAQAARSNMMKSLINDYKTLGKLSAQFANDGDLTTKAMLDNLKEEITRKRQSLKLTMDENVSLREKYSTAFDAEKRLLDATKAQKEIDAQNKANVKEAETAWKKQVKDAQRATGINAATTAANAGDQTVIRAIGAEGVSKDIENKAKELSNQIKTLRMLRDEIDKKGDQASAEDRDNLSKQIVKAKELKSEMDSYLKIHEKYSGEGVTDLGDGSNFGAVGTNEYWNNITAAIKNASTGRVAIKGMNADTGELTGTTKIAANTFATWSATVDPLTGRLSMLRTGIKKTETIVEQITRKTKEIFTYFSGSSIIFKAFNELKKGVQYVREIDLALTELKKVTDETEETYDKFLETAAKTGARLGTTISAVTEATATFAKLGYTMEQATEMAEAAIVYKNVGDNIASTGDAADSIISTLKGFGMEASDAMAIVDRFNEVGNRFAITSQGIGEALRLSASALNEGKNSLDESIALITAANEVVNDPSSVGTALKTLTLRLRGAKTELEEMGEDVTGMATTTSQLQAKLLSLTGGQVDIMLDENTFKNSTQILREMAAAWEDMNDIQRASALELMGGKRQANVLSALIQNFDTVEKVIETSAQSSGSALKENERYLDSIQGKVDQFNNAMQAMWSNTLDSDLVKDIVEFGTVIVKVIDKVGLLNSALITLATISMVKNKMGPIEFFKGISDGIRNIAGKIGGFIGSLTGATAATSAYTAETLAASVANGTLSASEAASIASKNGLALATTNLTATEATEMLMRAGVAKADALAMVAKLGLTSSTQALSLADIQAAVSSGALTAAQGELIASTLGLTAANTGLTASLMALWTALWPILAVMAAFMVVGFIVKNFDKWTRSTKYLREELSGLKSEISDAKSEIESLNGELETTQERMAELLAKDSLTFTEQEELENLQKQNDLLEREIYLLEQREKRLQKDAQKTFDEIMEKETKEKDRDGDGEDDVYDKSLERKMRKYEKWAQEYEDAKQALVEAEKSEDENAIKKAEDRVERAEKKKDKFYGKVNKELDQYLQDADGIDYASADEQTKKYLDYIYNTEGRFNIANGDAQAKSTEIKRIFNKDDMSDASDKIDKLVEKLAENPGDKNIIAQIGEQCKLAEKDLEAIGLSVQDATDYFTKLGSSASYNTIEGKLAEITEASKRMTSALSGDFDKSSFNDLSKVQQMLSDKGWIDKKGNPVSDAIAEYFGGEDGGVSEETRTEIERLVKQIYDGKITVQDALKSFELFGVQSVIDIQVAEVKTNFKDVFVDLGDADGLINTFEELGSAIGSTVGALEAFNQAQADVADKGFVSIQTALQLMEYTDDYGSVLQVVNGKLQLTENAEQNLIQARINAIKVSAQTAVADAQAAYDKAQLAVQSYRSAMVEEASASTVATAWQKIVAVAAGIKNALDNIWSGKSIGDLYNSGYNTYLEKATGYKTSYDDAGLQALEDALADADKKLNEAKGNSEIANALTADNIEDLYNPSDKSTVDEVEDDAFQREMDYWENRIAANQAKYEQIQNEIDLLEAKGQKADTSFYEEQIKLEGERKWLLEQQKAAAKTHLATLEEGSEAWWEVANTLNDIEGELDDVTASIVDLQDAIGEIDTYKFEEFNNRLDNLTSKLETIRNLIAPNGEEDWFDDEGGWTEAGVAVLGSHIQDLEFFKQGYQNTMDELAKYEPDYAGNESYYETLGIHSEQEYYDKVEELTDNQYQFAESISDTKQSVVDMYESSVDAVEEYIDTLIDGYNDYIDSVKEALDAERDLYDFKKNVQKQAKDIAEIERRIMSLSGSTNAADIAERRRLEADLYGAREELDNTYYDHAKESQQSALDAEAEAYEEQMTQFIDGLRISLEEATANMDEFLMGVTTMVMYNADTVLSKYEETNLPLTKELTNPWEEAKKATNSYSGNALDLMNQWTKQGGFFAQFNASGTTNLSSPWSAGTTAANTFKSDVSTVMSGVVSNISTNVKAASGELSKLYQQIQDTEKRAASANVAVDNANSNGVGSTGGYVAPQKKYYVTAFLDMGGRSLSVTKSDSDASKAMSAAKIAILGEYEKVKGNSISAESAWQRTWRNKVKYTTQYYAKGTTGTKRDKWAVTDEPQFGDELTMYATPEGTLSFMRAGSTVIPADLTRELIELPGVVDGLVNMPKFDSGINVINNAVNKPEFNLSFEALVKAERIDENTLPEVKKYVQQEINTLVKQMNYAIKGRGGR